jgi:hypothetical protein
MSMSIPLPGMAVEFAISNADSPIQQEDHVQEVRTFVHIEFTRSQDLELVST